VDLGLKGKTALVVGAGRGIGRAIALALASEGVSLGAWARSGPELESLAQAMGPNAQVHVQTCDVTQAAEVESRFAELERTLGRIEIVVYCVAALFEPKKLQFVDSQEAELYLRTDLGAAIQVFRRALPGMMEARFGRLVALGSLAARAGVPGGTLYAAAKAGLEGLVRGIAVDYARRGITANVVAPGFVETERLAKRLLGSDAARKELEDRTAARRLVRAEEVADAVTFLCSPRAGAITGIVLEVTAGAHLVGAF
jgi:3-oxoacyl-[acyl-carrier protein] reductase